MQAVAIASGTGDVTVKESSVQGDPARGQPATGDISLLGWSFQGAAGAVWYLRSESTSGPVIATGFFTAEKRCETVLFPKPLRARTGIYLDRDASNAVEGVVYVA